MTSLTHSPFACPLAIASGCGALAGRPARPASFSGFHRRVRPPVKAPGGARYWQAGAAAVGGRTGAGTDAPVSHSDRRGLVFPGAGPLRCAPSSGAGAGRAGVKRADAPAFSNMGGDCAPVQPCNRDQEALP
jgi:hypothetical protein